MPIWIKIGLDLLLLLSNNRQVQSMTERCLRKLAQRNGWTWDEEILDSLFPKEGSNNGRK